MPFTAAQNQRVRDAIQAKIGGAGRCPLCGHSNWTIANDLVNHALQPNPGAFSIGGPSIPTVALICTVCGNTHFLNVLVLGLGELVKPGGGG